MWPFQAEEQARKREIRLMKNREAARECRNKKKEYIKCLENRWVKDKAGADGERDFSKFL